MCEKEDKKTNIDIKKDNVKKMDRKKSKFAQGVDPIFLIEDDNI